MADKITAQDIQSMVSHWLGTPVNGYLGSGYGSNLQEMLLTPMASGEGDEFIAKLKVDVPVTAAAPPGSVNAYYSDQGPDKRNIIIEVAGVVITSATATSS